MLIVKLSDSRSAHSQIASGCLEADMPLHVAHHQQLRAMVQHMRGKAMAQVDSALSVHKTVGFLTLQSKKTLQCSWAFQDTD